MTTFTLVIDTATAACSVALFDGDRLVGARHEVVGRGHAERVVAMVAELPGGGRADHVLVDIGPGSFTGIRVGIAAARGLALGWGVGVSGYHSLALIAVAALADGPVPDLAVVTEGGHGEVFMARYAHPFALLDAPRSLSPDAALSALGGARAIGSGTRWLAQVDPAFPVADALPDAARAMLLPPAMRALPATPFYGRAPDAKLPPARA